MQYTITNTDWTQISDAGKNIVVFLDEQSDGSKGQVDVRVFDSILKPALSEITNAKRVYKPTGNNDVLPLSPIPRDKCLWAICANVGDEATIQVNESGYGINQTIDTFLQDQSSGIIDVFLTRKLGTATLASPTALEDRTITLVAGHGFTAGEMIEIDNGDTRFYQSRVRLVVGNVLTLNNPLCFAFPVTANVKRTSMNMNIDASAAPIIFSAYPPQGVKWDINILSINMLDATDMDDSLFGGIPALTNGVCFRTVDGDNRNIFTALDNGCFRRHCDTEDPYSVKAPSGSYGFNSKRHFNGQNGDGVAKRIGGTDVAQFQAVLADNLTGLTRFWCVLRGHVVD